jgi:peptidoglycan/LPS O-acetylase OafA/YrhL
MGERSMRVTYAIAVWAFVLAVVIQFFLAGVGVFTSGPDSFQPHRGLGWMLPLGPLLLLLLGAAAKAGRNSLWLLGAVLLLIIVQSILVAAGRDAPLIAALHPVNGLAIFTLTLFVARRATVLSSIRDEARPAAPQVSTALDPETAREG